jgi:hypothetical protein
LWRAAHAELILSFRNKGGTKEVNMANIRSGATSNRRAFKRKSVLQAAALQIGTSSSPCSVIDISVGGAQIEIEPGVENGKTATLAIENFGAFEAQVAWARKDRCGLKFTGDPEVIAESLMAMATYG